MYKRIWIKLLLIPLILMVSTALEVEAGRVRVRGYYRKDGTYVRPHYRTAPDSNPYNNYSFPGNYNPNTGRITPGDPQKYLDRYYNRSKTYKPATTYTPLPTYKSSSTYRVPMTKRSTSQWLVRPSTKVLTTPRSTTSRLEVERTISQARQILNGAVLIADDGNATYLGKIGGNYETYSIFNTYGQHGSDYAVKSIFNDYGRYGSNYSQYSPFYKFALSPPYIVKNGKIIARLTANETLKAQGHVVVSPYTLMIIYGRTTR